jgi:HSP20 family protein
MALTTFHDLNNIFDIIDGIDKFDNVFFRNKYDNMFFRHMPPVDLKENDMDYILTVDAPGVDKNDIKINIDHGRLNFSYERLNDTQHNNDRIHFSEKRYGKVSRTISLPKNIIEENIKATYDNGILNIKIPKLNTNSTSRNITIS